MAFERYHIHEDSRMASSWPVWRFSRRCCDRDRRFSWGGWVTGGTARQQAADRADTAVVAALAGICVDQSRRDPLVAERVTALKAAASYGRAEIVMKNGWATMPGTKDPSRQVASACGDRIASS